MMDPVDSNSSSSAAEETTTTDDEEIDTTFSSNATTTTTTKSFNPNSNKVVVLNSMGNAYEDETTAALDMEALPSPKQKGGKNRLPQYLTRFRGPLSMRKKDRKKKPKKLKRVKLQQRGRLKRWWEDSVLASLTRWSPDWLVGYLPWASDEELALRAGPGGQKVSRKKQQRTIKVSDRVHNKTFRFANNSISTTKYTPWSFIFKNLWEQFHRLANVWFLIVAVIQLIPGVSPLNPASSIIPLVFVLGVTAIKEAYEDIKRRISDGQVNSQKVEAFVDGRFQELGWKDVKVGDLLIIRNNETIPADLFLLSSSQEDGLAYVETANLDGETNLKVRQALEETATIALDEQVLAEFRAEITYEPPNPKLYKFDGAVDLPGQTQSIPLRLDQTLWRGCTLRNTEWALGVAIFTGMESKIMKNARKPPSKRSSLERQMNACLLQVFLFALAVDALAAFIHGVWSVQVGFDHWYLRLEDIQSSGAVIGLEAFASWLILLNVIIPISLYVYMEIVKLVMVWWINSDMEMFHEESNTPAKANTSNLSEQLGQIEYIFSDKTGTLTANQMDFMKCSISGISFGTPPVSKGKQDSEISEDMDSDDENDEQLVQPDVGKEAYIFHDPKLMNLLHDDDDQQISSETKEFFRLLALCHTVIIEKLGEEEQSTIKYQASSPDEAALVDAAAKLGFVLKERSQSTITIEVLGQEEVWEFLNVLEFNSDRKRMSVILRDPRDGKVKLFCKGADSVIVKRLAPGQDQLVQTTTEHLKNFADSGLRTLGLAYKEISDDEYEDWNSRYYEASILIQGREEALDAVAEEIEQNLVLMGATAIEDKLQDGVPDAIRTLLQMGIKLWVLTGDKMETAINIGYSCNLLNSAMKQLIFSSQPFFDGNVPITDERSARRAVEKQIRKYFPTIKDPITNNGTIEMQELSTAATVDAEKDDEIGDDEDSSESEDEDSTSLDGTPRQYAIVIDGSALEQYLQPEGFTPLSARFLELAMQCKVVICCRVSPLQKALVVKLVNKLLKANTLSIGDGANDVPMIQEANIGVGISGKEGRQAVLASDYAIAQFRYLVPLLLVHGYWSYKRMALLLLYSFYKNIVFALPNFWFGIYSSFSAQTMFDSWAVSIYNIAFTGLPIVMLACFDQVVRRRELYANPQLYQSGIRGIDFNKKKYWGWQLMGMIQSLIITFFGMLTFWYGNVGSNGWSFGVFTMGCTVLTAVILTVSAKLVIISHTWTLWNHLVLYLSLFLWFLFLIVYQFIPDNPVISPNDLFWSSNTMFGTAAFWLGSIVAACAAFVPDLAVTYILRTFFPHDYNIIEEERKMTKRQLRVQKRAKFLRFIKFMGLEKTPDGRKEAPQIPVPKNPDHHGYAFSQSEGQRDLLTSLKILPVRKSKNAPPTSSSASAASQQKNNSNNNSNRNNPVNDKQKEKEKVVHGYSSSSSSDEREQTRLTGSSSGSKKTFTIVGESSRSSHSSHSKGEEEESTSNTSSDSEE
ncbi:Phospholipid-transporting ATPase [Balamuthia mandrillaris]